MIRFTDRRFWLIASAALLVFVALVAAVSFASGGLKATSSSGNTATGFTTPAGAQVLEIGAVSGPNGSALLNARDSSLTALNVQFLEFSDEETLPASLAAGTGDAVIVPEGTKLEKGQEVLAKLYNVEFGGTKGVQLLVAPQDSPLISELKTLVEALQSQATVDYLNTVPGVKATSIK